MQLRDHRSARCMVTLNGSIDVAVIATVLECLAEMISPPAGIRVWIAAGMTDLRRGFTGLSAAVQTILEQDPYSGHVFVFRGRRGDLIKVLWWDRDGLCLFVKQTAGRCHLVEHSYCYSKASTGGSRH